MNHTALQSAVPPDTLANLRSIIHGNGVDNTLKAIAGILAEHGKTKTAEYVLVARTESLMETPRPKSPPPLPLQWWAFAVNLVENATGNILDSATVYVRNTSMNQARHIAAQHVKDTWGMAQYGEKEPQRVDCACLGVRPDTDPMFNRPDTVFTVGMPLGGSTY